MPTNIRILTLLCLITIGLGLSACGTVEGAGHDIEHAGEAIQDSAN